MADNVIVSPLTNLEGSSAVQKVNENFNKLAEAFDKVLWKDGKEEVDNDLDLNGRKILNVGDPVDPTDVVRVKDVSSLITDVIFPPIRTNTFNTSSELAASNVENGSAILAEEGKAGTFTLRDYSDFVTEVAEDTTKTNYIRSATDPSKVWVRTTILPSGASQIGTSDGSTVQEALDNTVSISDFNPGGSWVTLIATAGQTVFTFTGSAGIPGELEINEQPAELGIDYTRSGDNFTLIDPASANDRVDFKGQPLIAGLPSLTVSSTSVPALSPVGGVSNIQTEIDRRSIAFQTRDSFKNSLAQVSLVTPGVLVNAGAFTYRRNPSSTKIPDLPGWDAVKPSFAHFGADLTGVSDVASSVSLCLASYGECYIPEDGVEHQISTVQGTGFIRGTYGKSYLKMVGTDIPFKFYGSLGTTNAFSSTAGPGTREVSFFSSIADLVPGQWVMLEADRPPIPNMTAQGTGEIVQIESITGQTIKFVQALAFDYSPGVTRNLRRINWARNSGITGVTIRGRLDVDVTPTIPGLPLVEFRFCQGGVVEGCEMYKHKYATVNLMASHACRVSGNYFHDLLSADDDVNGGFGYGVQEQAVNLGNLINGNIMQYCRTGYTTGAGSTATYKYGVPMNSNITSNTMSSMAQSGCSSHEAGYYLNFSSNTINGCRAMGINVRAVGHVISGNMITNTTGAGVLIVASPNGDVRDTVVTNNTLIRTNQGVVPQGGTSHTEIGAINSNGPNTIISDNIIMYCGGPAIRFNYAQVAMITGNRIFNPCQLTSTEKYAIGVKEGAGYAIVANNYLISTDSKTTNFIFKRTGYFLEGQGNISYGITGANLAGETAGNYALGGFASSKVNYGYRETSVPMSGNSLNIDSVRSGILSIQAPSGSGGVGTLSTITGGIEGSQIVLRPVSGATITLQNGTGNIRTRDGSNKVISTSDQIVTLVRIGTNWIQPQ